jgi:RND family efflux transporter MFP subunit
MKQGDFQMSRIFNFFKNKKWLVTAFMVIAILITLGFYSTNTGQAEQVETVKVVSLNLAETVEATGTLEAQPFASLNWKTNGVVESVNVKPGQNVKKGDVLLTLQPDSTSASVASAQADLVSARQNLEDTVNSDSKLAQAIIDLKEAREDYEEKSDNLRYLQNSDTKTTLTDSYGWYNYNRKGQWTYISKTRYYPGPASEDVLTNAENEKELARAKMEDLQHKVERLTNNDQDILAAQAKVDAAQATVNSMSIIAPFDGQVLSVEDHIGDVINAGALSVNIADLNHLYVEAQVDESDVAKIRASNRVTVTLDALPGVELSGTVESINPVGRTVSGLVKYAVRVALDEVADKTFLPLGSTANVSIEVKSEAAVLAAPITAIHNDSLGEYVLVTQTGGLSERVKVVSGSIVGDMVVINGDLHEGDNLLLAARESGFEVPNPFGGGGK